ncbi:uncharacterized protein LOC123467372 [Daphnia magna]|nr:uncharacterized protein LOC123467372 [Daphnia magna]
MTSLGLDSETLNGSFNDEAEYVNHEFTGPENEKVIEVNVVDGDSNVCSSYDCNDVVNSEIGQQVHMFDSEGEIDTDSSGDEQEFHFNLNSNDEVFAIREGDGGGASPSVTHSAQRFRDEISEWVVQYQIKHSSVDALLKIFTLLPGFEKLGLPKTCRTLLQTIRQTPLRLVSPGHYYHFGITESIELLLKRLNVDRVDNDIIKIQFNVDGIPIAKSSESCLWPILGLIERIDGSVPFPVGIYHGYGKPKDPNEFLYDFVREVCLLQQIGFVYNGRKIDVEVSGFLCDAPAMAFIKCIKSHTGYYSCSKCTVKGEWAGRVVFLNEEKGEKRTDATFRNRAHVKHHNNESSSLELLGVDMIHGFPLDYMHLVCLGIMRKMLWYWIHGPLNVRMGRLRIEKISERLLDVSCYIPREFVRKPRGFNELARWKATEFRQFLLYTGPVVLKGILPSHLYGHFLTLHSAIKILVSKELCQRENTYAKSLLNHFVDHCQRFYGDTFMSYNSHNLRHLADDVLMRGHLDTFSCFPFENYLYKLKHLIRKHEKPLPQVVRRLQEFANHMRLEVTTSSLGNPLLKRKHTDGPVPSGFRGQQYREVHLRDFVLKSDSVKDCHVYLKDLDVVKVTNFFEVDSRIFFTGRKYVYRDNVFTLPCESSRFNVFLLWGLDSLNWWPLDSILCKALVIPCGKRHKCAAFPLLMSKNY